MLISVVVAVELGGVERVLDHAATPSLVEMVEPWGHGAGWATDEAWTFDAPFLDE